MKAGQRQTAEHGAMLVVNDRDDHPITFQQTSVSIEVTHEGAPTVFFQIMETAPAGFMITQATAVDPDPSQRVYYLLEQDGDEFELDKETGEVRLARKLDRETEDRYE